MQAQTFLLSSSETGKLQTYEGFTVTAVESLRLHT